MLRGISSSLGEGYLMDPRSGERPSHRTVLARLYQWNVDLWDDMNHGCQSGSLSEMLNRVDQGTSP